MKGFKLMSISLMLASICVFSGGALAQDKAETTQYIAKSGSQPASIGPAAYFTGHVTIEPLFSDKGANAPLGGAYVTFAPGARSFWHTHPAGQHLIVTHGTGWTGTWEGVKTEIKAGDVVWCPPGVKHWHGAAASSPLTHLALTGTKDGQNVTWLEAVNDGQYNK